MAISAPQNPSQVHRFPQFKYIDAVRWLPPVSAFDRFAAIAFFDSDSNSPSIEIHCVNSNLQSSFPTLTSQSSWAPPSRISSLKTAHSTPQPVIAAATFSGSLHILASDLINGGMIESGGTLSELGFHSGPVAAVDLREGGTECVSVGEDGRINLVSFVGDSSNLSYRRIFDANGLVGYTAVKWASPSEFVTGGYGFGLQWWDQRRPGGPVSQFKGNWCQGKTSGIVHSIDIHPSRKHTCLAGGSSGTVFAWDLRAQQQPIVLAGAGTGEAAMSLLSESEVWEVQYDRYTRSSNISNISSTRILPVMICSEDGILAVVEQGEEPIELLADPCAINSFDINQQNPSDVICSLEWESIAILTRS
ncbi:nuclear pore complex protein NUP43-like [Durio zibethinus]|uniref:Nuclear pore complex protein NUP43-like n=1 Tax=Durio zibethinus TaxID=66656 RepID=A0A6P5XMV5_DURZI|nr:nuclear pore complex protein NUP43-like [Durio zibethinus]XP_022729494.1 nuclear pore complex protein NUP43-like [Durio zibethinus]